jgi:hypothetical protein
MMSEGDWTLVGRRHMDRWRYDGRQTESGRFSYNDQRYDPQRNYHEGRYDAYDQRPLFNKKENFSWRLNGRWRHRAINNNQVTNATVQHQPIRQEPRQQPVPQPLMSVRSSAPAQTKVLTGRSRYHHDSPNYLGSLDDRSKKTVSQICIVGQLLHHAHNFIEKPKGIVRMFTNVASSIHPAHDINNVARNAVRNEISTCTDVVCTLLHDFYKQQFAELSINLKQSNVVDDFCFDIAVNRLKTKYKKMDAGLIGQLRVAVLNDRPDDTAPDSMETQLPEPQNEVNTFTTTAVPTVTIATPLQAPVDRPPRPTSPHDDATTAQRLITLPLTSSSTSDVTSLPLANLQTQLTSSTATRPSYAFVTSLPDTLPTFAMSDVTAFAAATPTPPLDQRPPNKRVRVSPLSCPTTQRVIASSSMTPAQQTRDFPLSQPTTASEPQAKVNLHAGFSAGTKNNWRLHIDKNTEFLIIGDSNLKLMKIAHDKTQIEGYSGASLLHINELLSSTIGKNKYPSLKHVFIMAGINDKNNNFVQTTHKKLLTLANTVKNSGVMCSFIAVSTCQQRPAIECANVDRINETAKQQFFHFMKLPVDSVAADLHHITESARVALANAILAFIQDTAKNSLDRHFQLKK